ncbi:unnamed protein product [Brassicogethes aeneus]|uniref:Uncharacterized protein n=1 Tax=Brassicogethes aeneus TaxID=1431903 RepID=A0A9P0AXC5_BRAAE|nr:unnamed protein product [Brassicogethes aeneus]
MNRVTTVLLFCVILYGSKVTFAEQNENDTSEEVAEEGEEHEESFEGAWTGNETEEVTVPLDSHEAMSNGMHKRTRDKRSYEFLMGLINNNSKFEVTKVDPEAAVAAAAAAAAPVATQDERLVEKSPPQQVTGKQIVASELLLELMVRIAAHPDQWEKVHQLLQKIDKDISLSQDILEDLKKNKLDLKEHFGNEELHVSKKISKPLEYLTPPKEQKIKTNKWPNFDILEKPENEKEDKPLQNDLKQLKPSYPKNFAYHRVTGKPIYLNNKNAKAYIAVSVIAPKIKTEDEVALENELRQLKPWSHQENVNNMENLRSNWLIHQKEKKKENIEGL